MRRPAASASSPASGRRRLGATMIGTVGSRRRRQRWPRRTAARTSSTTRPRTSSTRVKEITGGQGCRRGLRLDRQGHLSRLARLPEAAAACWVTLRQCLGPGAPVRLSACCRAKGSLLRHAADAVHLHGAAADLLANAADLFAWWSSGKVKIDVNHTLSAADAAQAHRDLEARKTTGSTVLLP